MTDKKKFKGLDFSDITDENQVVPEPVVFQENVPVIPAVTEPLKNGLWIGGKPLLECSGEEIKEWAIWMCPAPATINLDPTKLVEAKAKEKLVNNMLLLASTVEYFLVTKRENIPKKYIN